jgi:hypothetical protein
MRELQPSLGEEANIDEAGRLIPSLIQSGKF